MTNNSNHISTSINKKTYNIMLNEKIGLDAITLNNITIHSIQKDVLLSHAIKNKQIRYTESPDSPLGFTYIQIKSSPFPFCIFQLLYNSQRNSYTTKVQLCVDAELQEGNLNNWSMKDLGTHIDTCVIPELKEYGIDVSFEDAVFTRMEINYNILLPAPYDSFHPVICRMLWNCSTFYTNYASDYYKIHKNEYGLFDTKIHENIVLSQGKKNSVKKTLTAYDKTAKLQKEKGLYTDASILRLEYRLESSQAIKNTFNYNNRFYHLTDQDIANLFCKKIISPLYKYITEKYWTEERRKTKELYLKYRNTYNNKFNKIIYEIDEKSQENGSPYILTSRSMENLLHGSNEFKHNGNRQRSIRSFRKALSHSLSVKPEYKDYLYFFEEKFSKMLDCPTYCEKKEILFTIKSS